MSARARALRRRSRPSPWARVRAWWVVGLLAAIALAGAVLALVNLPQFRVRTVDAAVPARSPITKEAVLAAAAIEPGANLWLLDTGAVRARVEALPYVATARVRRTQFPAAAAVIEVTARVPYACVDARSGTVAVDVEGRVLQRDCPDPGLAHVDVGDAPAAAPGEQVTVPDITRLLDDHRTIARHLAVRAVRRDRFGGLEAVDTQGVTIKFGKDDDLPAKLALVEPIRKAAGAGRRLRAIDLRAPGTPVVEFP